MNLHSIPCYMNDILLWVRPNGTHSGRCRSVAPEDRFAHHRCADPLGEGRNTSIYCECPCAHDQDGEGWVHYLNGINRRNPHPRDDSFYFDPFRCNACNDRNHPDPPE